MTHLFSLTPALHSYLKQSNCYCAFVRNAEKHFRKKMITLYTFEGAFIWERTPEGHNFWAHHAENFKLFRVTHLQIVPSAMNFK